MAKQLFPELDEKSMTDLIGLKIVKVVSDLHDAIKVIQCEDEKGELREITFAPVDSSCIAVKLDDIEVASLLTEV